MTHDARPTCLESEKDLASESTKISRRSVLGVSLGTAVTATSFGLSPAASAATGRSLPLPLTPPDITDINDVGDTLLLASAPTMHNVKLTLRADGTYLFELPRLDSGQGTSTALAQMVAEEAGVSVDKVVVVAADGQPNLLMNQITGGSCALRTFAPFIPGMVARARAARGLPRQAGAPKDPRQYKVIGKRINKTDALDIVTGRKKFTMDLDVPDAKPTMCRMPSQILGTVLKVNNLSAVKSMPGVIAVEVIQGKASVVNLPTAVAVMAETFGQAWDACRALDITWGDGPNKGLNNEQVFGKLRAAIPPIEVPKVANALSVDGEFVFSAASHCPMEVETAIVSVKNNKAEIWAGLQCPILTLQAIADDLGLRESAVTSHVIPSGGAFGRRVFWDGVQIAAQMAKRTGQTCKLMYHRTDDVRHHRNRPPQVHKVRATVVPPSLLGIGTVVSYNQNIGIVRLDARHGFGERLTATAANVPTNVVQTLGNMTYEQVFFRTMVSSPYNYGVSTKLLFPVALDIPSVTYRSVHIQPARTCEEIITDEIAARFGKDPVEFRLEFLRLPRAKAVLKKVAEMAQWGKSMPAGFAQGVAVHMESRSFTACVVELDGRDPNNAKVTRASVAIDVGVPVNPSGIEQQVLGGIAEAIALVLNAGLTYRDGGIVESSYKSYRFTKMADFPKQVDIEIMPASGEAMGGLGEVVLTAPASAIANAYAKATGIKPRKFPLNAQPAAIPTPAGQLPAPSFT